MGYVLVKFTQGLAAALIIGFFLWAAVKLCTVIFKGIKADFTKEKK